MAQNITNQLISLILRTSRLIRESFKKEKRGGQLISFVQLEALRYIKEEKNPLMKNVAADLCITPPSATPLIDGLVKSGLIKRIFDYQDRRIIRLIITSKGEGLLKQELEKMINHMRQVVSQLDPEEQKELVKILQKLANIYQ